MLQHRTELTILSAVSVIELYLSEYDEWMVRQKAFWTELKCITFEQTQ